MTDKPDLSVGRDEELGAMLRAHFSAPDDAQFAARMRVVATAAAEETAWRTVARWTLPGLAAAAVLLAVIGAALGGRATPDTGRTASTSAAGSLVEMASGGASDNGGVLLAAMTY